VADNFFTSAARVAAATFSDVEDVDFTWSGVVRAATYAAAEAGVPSETATDIQMLSGDDVSRVQNGTLFNRPRWDYVLRLDLDVPDTPTKWISLTPETRTADGSAYWLTSDVPSQTPNSYFRTSLYSGYPIWTPLWIVIGEDWDFAFTLTFTGDCNTNDVLDVCDIQSGVSLDCDTDQIPDDCQDCNTNGIGDPCEVAQGTSTDCDTNNVVDECDILGSSAADCDTNLLPDECDPECNTNGLVDACEIASGISPDCNTNQVPDACDGDCNTNGLTDVCDVGTGTSWDCNTNVVPDECEIAVQIWDNGSYDYSFNGFLNQIGGMFEGVVADDFVSDAPGRVIVHATFQDFERTNFLWDGTVLVRTWEDGGGSPSENPFDEQWISWPNVTRVQFDYLPHGVFYEYMIDSSVRVPGVGPFWFSATPSTQYDSLDWAAWSTSAVPAKFGHS